MCWIQCLLLLDDRSVWEKWRKEERKMSKRMIVRRLKHTIASSHIFATSTRLTSSWPVSQKRSSSAITQTRWYASFYDNREHVKEINLNKNVCIIFCWKQFTKEIYNTTMCMDKKQKRNLWKLCFNYLTEKQITEGVVERFALLELRSSLGSEKSCKQTIEWWECGIEHIHKLCLCGGHDRISRR